MPKNLVDLTVSDIAFIKSTYSNPDMSQKEKQILLATHYGVSRRTIRRWTKDFNIKPNGCLSDSIIMTYDIETTLNKAWVWDTGKTYVGHKSLIDETKIISICYKYLGDDTVYTIVWDNDEGQQCDKRLIIKFLEVYNKVDMVIGQNNDNFDNKIVVARAMKYGLYVNMHQKSFDIYKQVRRIAKLPSYSLDYMTKYFGVAHKLSHEGIVMWKMIQEGTPQQKEEYIKKMVDYNIGDIVSTEALYLRLRPYLGHKMHFGAMGGQPRFASPSDGTCDVELFKFTSTARGTIQAIMISNTDLIQYNISLRDYHHFLDYKIQTQSEL